MAGNLGITAAVLAGGLGTRLRPTVADRPKVLAPVGGRPDLAYLLDQLDAVGIGEVVLLTGYRAEQVRAAFGESYSGIRLRDSAEPVPLGTGGAARRALPLLSAPTILLLNGDSYCAVDLDASGRSAARFLIGWSARHPDAIHLLSVLWDDLVRPSRNPRLGLPAQRRGILVGRGQLRQIGFAAKEAGVDALGGGRQYPCLELKGSSSGLTNSKSRSGRIASP